MNSTRSILIPSYWVATVLAFASALAMLFIYTPTETSMGQIQKIFYLHLPVAMCTFLACFVTFIASIGYLTQRDSRWDDLASGSASVAVQLCTVVLLTGVVQYSVNYWGVYEAERHIPSGLVAVLFSLMVFGNALSGWWLFKQPVTSRFLVAATCGVLGVVLIFWPEVVATGARPHAALGLGVGLLAVVMACTGNALTLSLTRRGVPLLPLLGWGMTYGAIVLLGVAAAQGSLGAIGRSAAWWSSLLYLTLFGTVIAFFVYFRLAQRVGPARAAMTGVMIPPIALVISAALEGCRPTVLSLVGVVLCLGSVFVATRAPSRALA